MAALVSDATYGARGFDFLYSKIMVLIEFLNLR